MNRLRKNMLFIVLMTVLAVFFFGCEGPAGPDGADGADGSNGSNGSNGSDGTDGTDGIAGIDGIDGNVTCLVCHSDENLAMKQHEFAASQHSSGDIAVSYAGGRGSCSKCHSHEGFVAFADGLTAHNISNPSAWKCATCHNLHTTFEYEDYALRLTDAVAIWNGGSFLLKGNNTFSIQGSSNLCANCHQSRRGGPTDMGGQMVDLDDDDVDETEVPAGSFFISSTHYGPHHGAQANVLAGEGFAEIEGSISYPAAGSATHVTPACVGCHMVEGDHSFEPSLDGCTDCHTSITTFDHNGSQSDIQELLDELRDLLIAAGVIELGTEELYELNEETGVIELVLHTEGYHPVVGIYDVILAEAFFNWVGLVEDRSVGVHNPNYVNALLKNTIAAVEAL